MPSSVFIFHGTGGYPGENWFPWLKARVEENGHKCIVPHFPTPEGQSLEAWFEILKPYEKYLGLETILIGHSLGGLFLLRLLEHLDHQIKAAFFVATPVGVEPVKNYAADEAFAGGFSFNWEKIKTKARHSTIYHSDNDPYVPLENGKLLAEKLGVTLTFIPNAGHFNEAAGYTTFPELWEDVQMF